MMMTAVGVSLVAQSPASTTTAQPQPKVQAAGAADQTAASLPPDYVIGAEDILSIVYWRDKDMSGDVSVRPDGKITLPLLNEVQAVGLTPAQLRDRLVEASRQYIED